MARKKLATALLIGMLLGILFVPNLASADQTTRPAVVKTAVPANKPLRPTPKPRLKTYPRTIKPLIPSAASNAKS
jgi:hypothetical protein